MSHQVWIWVAFNVFVLMMLAVDLGVLHRRAHEVALKEALVWSGIWIALALLFALGVYAWDGPQPALEFLTGYLIEKSLSVDNIFVFVLIFSYFKVPARYQHEVLFWGILGALVMRAIFIFAGIALLQRLHWIIYVFGALLILTGIKMAMEKDKEIHPDKKPLHRCSLCCWWWKRRTSSLRWTRFLPFWASRWIPLSCTLRMSLRFSDS